MDSADPGTASLAGVQQPRTLDVLLEGPWRPRSFDSLAWGRLEGYRKHSSSTFLQDASRCYGQALHWSFVQKPAYRTCEHDPIALVTRKYSQGSSVSTGQLGRKDMPYKRVPRLCRTGVCLQDQHHHDLG